MKSLKLLHVFVIILNDKYYNEYFKEIFLFIQYFVILFFSYPFLVWPSESSDTQALMYMNL